MLCCFSVTVSWAADSGGAQGQLSLGPGSSGGGHLQSWNNQEVNIHMKNLLYLSYIKAIYFCTLYFPVITLQNYFSFSLSVINDKKKKVWSIIARCVLRRIFPSPPVTAAGGERWLSATESHDVPRRIKHFGDALCQAPAGLETGL